MDSDLKILVVDDHKLFAAGLSRLLAGLAPVVDVTEKYSATQAVSVLENGQHFDLILLELDLPSMSGLDLLLAIKSRRIQTPAVVISATDNCDEIRSAIDCGAKGFIPKSSSVALLKEALKQVLDGEIFLPDYIMSGVSYTSGGTSISMPITKRLSGRQKEIVHLIQMGKTNKQIADILDIKQSTVKFHISALFKTLKVRTRTECVHVARQRNLTT